MKLRYLFGLFLCLTSWPYLAIDAEKVIPHLPTDITPELSNRGEHQVGVKTLSAVNLQHSNPLDPTETERTLVFEIWYPAAANTAPNTSYENEARSGATFNLLANAARDVAIKNDQDKYPVVVISHGYTGYRTIMFHIAEHLASHGYVVVGVDHTDSTNADVDFTVNPGSGFLSTLMNRATDQQFALEWLATSEFAEHVDTSKSGLIGYSMGGFGAINTIGGCYAFTPQHVAAISGSDDEQQNALLTQVVNHCAAKRAEGADASWQAAVLIAPWGGQLKVYSADSIAAVKVPTLYIAGDLDDISGYSGIRWMYEQHQGAEAWLLTYQNARHNIAPHPAPHAASTNELDIGHYYEPSWNMATIAVNNQHFILAMMDCQIKQSADACEYLAVEGSSNQEMINGQLSAPWKGFDNRYSTGMIMEKKGE
ncbi:dienelactone hydrolase family protein [Alteromonas sp. ASW11-36]|uniref:Dienelactone hydrolase family protein n=1 Tax=Alteromonas arenosi TaxID=3055817 RepID=A0ABT7SSU4_9ALTE|nr:dienelactone hydrolase family protein [Alteromonas sp. ASW11-36]MDM7859220.1 dienelactone hydrolase family protein [Alteromonas sp. ASW11-36]